MRTHTEMRYGDWRCGSTPCHFPNYAYRTECHKCQAPKSRAKWELPQDPRTRTCRCGAKILPNFGACRVCRSPIVPLEGGDYPYNPQGDAPLPAPPIGGDLQGHSAEPIMLWTEAMVNPAGPPQVSGAWPLAPEIHYEVAREPDGSGSRVPYVTSDVVAAAWQVDHDRLCGKFLGHRRRAWKDTNPPALFYLWRTGLSQFSSLGIAFIPVWSDHCITFNGFLADGSPIQGLWPPVERTHACPMGSFARERTPPFLAQWPEDWKPRTHRLAEVGRAGQPNGDPAGQGGPERGPGPWGAQADLPYGMMSTPMQPWPAVAGMAWIRPDPAST